MATKKWDKSPASHVEAFASALPAHVSVERRTMFSYPCAFVNGNMFCGLHEKNICVRLGRDTAEKRIADGQASVFAPMPGRVMREYVAIPKRDCSDAARLARWLEEGLQYALSLPPRKAKAKVSRKPPPKSKVSK